MEGGGGIYRVRIGGKGENGCIGVEEGGWVSKDIGGFGRSSGDKEELGGS